MTETDINDTLNRMNGQIAAAHMVATLAISFAAGNQTVARNLAQSIANLSNNLDPNNHEEFNRGFKESITKIENIIANSTFEGGAVRLDIE